MPAFRIFFLPHSICLSVISGRLSDNSRHLRSNFVRPLHPFDSSMGVDIK
jgi:hypothetical protein